MSFEGLEKDHDTNSFSLEKSSHTKSLKGSHKTNVHNSAFTKLFMLTRLDFCIIICINYAKHHRGSQQYQTSEGQLILPLITLFWSCNIFFFLIYILAILSKTIVYIAYSLSMTCSFKVTFRRLSVYPGNIFSTAVLSISIVIKPS